MTDTPSDDYEVDDGDDGDEYEDDVDDGDEDDETWNHLQRTVNY
jgi:hypothetical protein